MATELWLVRHGQAAFGTDDYDRLTDLGWQQARWLGAHLAGRTFTRLAAGPLRRQIETAEALAEPLRLSVETVPGLAEYDFDALLEAAGHGPEPVSRADHFRRLRHILADWAGGGLVDAPESWAQFQDRLRAAVTDLATGSGPVIAASSGGAIAAITAQVLGLPPGGMIDLNLQARNTGITRLVFTRRATYLNMFNAIPHLDQPERHHAETYS